MNEYSTQTEKLSRKKKRDTAFAQDLDISITVINCLCVCFFFSRLSLVVVMVYTYISGKFCTCFVYCAPPCNNIILIVTLVGVFLRGMGKFGYSNARENGGGQRISLEGVRRATRTDQPAGKLGTRQQSIRGSHLRPIHACHTP